MLKPANSVSLNQVTVYMLILRTAFEKPNVRLSGASLHSLVILEVLPVYVYLRSCNRLRPTFDYRHRPWSRDRQVDKILVWPEILHLIAVDLGKSSKSVLFIHLYIWHLPFIIIISLAHGPYHVHAIWATKTFACLVSKRPVQNSIDGRVKWH